MGVIITIRRWSFDLKSITVEPVMFIYMFNVFLNFVTFQALVYDKVCKMKFNSTVCKNLENMTFALEEDTVQKTTSTWLLYSNLTMAVPGLLTVMFLLGPCGDRLGRKLPVLCPIIGAILSTVSNLVNAAYMDAPLEYLLIGTVLSGLFGGYIGALMAMYTYIAHISSPTHRTVRMGILEAMVFLSGTLGTAVSGVILDNTSYVFVFGLLAGLLLMGLGYTVVWVDNIVPEQAESTPDPLGWAAVMLGVVKDVAMCVWKSRSNKNLLNLCLLSVIIFFLMLVNVGENDIILIFTRHRPFKWSQTTFGLFKGTESLLRGLGMLILMPICKKIFAARDTVVMLAGLISKMISMIFYGLSQNTGVMFIGAISGILQGFSSASIRAQSAGMVKSNEQGKLFSLMALFESIASMVATSLFNPVYNATLDFFHGFCFLMAAGIMCIGIALGIVLHVRVSRSGQQNYNHLAEDTLDIAEHNDQSVQEQSTAVDIQS
ncbi:proton-coupled folate transporter-like [Mya arenaria]|uniref:proton-coupled folate transporter-like n=1 Tax=Mya arenaria TaxID=6604 RepID=UPI0022E275AA|nr:proton-coupled folate transporter-like [Mya arenaria]XP_052769459.1 proton-coupled folate transporter-like [Mya arenaria]